MHDTIQHILNTFNKSNICTEIDYFNSNWHSKIPSLPGWYIIKTNTPISVLKSLNKPDGESHYNIPVRIEEIKKLYPPELVINQKHDEVYVIYNGHSKNLKSRAREHYDGHSKTACLALKQYPTLWDYKWYFCYFPVKALGLDYADHEILRKFIEQAWRARNGWPILCKE